MEARYPMLRGTIRGHDGGPRPAFIRFFACEADLSHDPPDDPLPDAVAAGTEPYLIVGAMAGG
jgi:molybdopterin synthase sulfur carrier subunit